MNITFLGTGTSHGVPALDCMINNYANCPQRVCELAKHDPRHRRTRSSIFIESEAGSILVDVSADFREQMLREEIKQIDSVLVTHSHADHVGGIPDIRSYTIDKALPLYGSKETIQSIRSIYSYVFDPHTFVGGGIPCIDTFEISGPCTIQGQKIIPIPVSHGRIDGCFGYRIGNIAYIPDVKSIDNKELEKLENLDILIINCLRKSREHSTHLILPESMAIARQLRPSFCYFIHMSHDIHYEVDSQSLDSWMAFSYDGLKVVV